MLGAATGIIPGGFIVFKYIEDSDDRKIRDSSELDRRKAISSHLVYRLPFLPRS